MFTPHDATLALIMMVTSAICWGSWANTFKGVKNYRFELFYWDYAVGIFLTSLIFAFTMGSAGNDSSSFLNNVHAADASNIGWALLAGVIFNLANLLLVAGIDMAGLATAFPVAIGIALVVGLLCLGLSRGILWVRDKRGRPSPGAFLNSPNSAQRMEVLCRPKRLPKPRIAPKQPKKRPKPTAAMDLPRNR